MANIEDLLNRASEVRDADQGKENTALRVGGLLVAVIEALSSLNSEQTAAIENALSRYFTDGELNYSALPVRLLEALRDIDDKYASKDASSLLLPIHSRTLLLDSMGRNLDGVDYSPQAGDLVWERGFVWTYNGTDYDQGGVPPSRHVVYINKHTGKHYLWNGSQMAESTGGGGISEDDIVANLNSGDNHKALAASMGSVLKQAITTILNSLSNSAFSTGRPTIVWRVPQTYRITYGTMSHCTGGSATEVTENNPFNVTLVPDNGYTFTANGASVTITMGGVDVTNAYFNKQTGVLSIPSVTGNVVISATAAMPQNYTVTTILRNCTSDAPASVSEGSGLNVQLTAASGYSLSNGTVSVYMGGVDITSTAYNASTKKVVITEVAGNVSITASAAESTNHTVTYNLTEVTKTAGATEVEDGGTLNVTLVADANYSGLTGIQESNQYTNKGFVCTDVLVYMNGMPLQPKTDYTVRQSAMNEPVYLTIPNVVGNIEILNVVFLPYSMERSGVANSATATTRMVHTDVLIPIPSSCHKLKILHNCTEDMGHSSMARMSVVFDENKDLKASTRMWYNSDGDPITWLYDDNHSSYVGTSGSGTIPSGTNVGEYARYIKLSLCAIDHTDTQYQNGVHGIDGCYLYDETNQKYLWRGYGYVNDYTD